MIISSKSCQTVRSWFGEKWPKIPWSSFPPGHRDAVLCYSVDHTHQCAQTHTHWCTLHISLRAHSVTRAISTTPAHWHVEMQPRRIRECSIVICALWNRSTNPKCLVMELAFHVDSIALSLFRWIGGWQGYLISCTVTTPSTILNLKWELEELHWLTRPRP